MADGKRRAMVAVGAAAVAIVIAVSVVALTHGEDTSDASTTAPSDNVGMSSFVVTMTHHFVPFGGDGIMALTNATGPCGPSPLGGSLEFMAADADVVLRDDDGTIVSKATLGAGQTENYGPAKTGTTGFEFDCVWTTTFTDVPEAPFFEVSVDGNDLVTISADEIDGNEADVNLR